MAVLRLDSSVMESDCLRLVEWWNSGDTPMMYVELPSILDYLHLFYYYSCMSY